MTEPDDPTRELELVFALAGPVGSDLEEVSRTLADALKKSEYLQVEEISVTALVRQLAPRSFRFVESPEEERIASTMDASNALRRLVANPAAVASAAIGEIRGRRKRAGGTPSRRAYIVRSLKRPEEVHLLRRVYGPGFFLIGVNVPRPARVESLARHIAASHNETPASPKFAHHRSAAEALAKRDEDEACDEYGQRLRDVFQLCDLFVSPVASSLFPQIDRFVRLILGDLGETPWTDEQFMFHAFGASLSSGALGRQVGAVLVSPTREVLGMGLNDVPKAGGGLYRADEHYDRRDIHEDRDSVNIHAEQILNEIVELGRAAGWPPIDDARDVFRKSRVMSLLEFGRTSHAEMEAVLAAGRAGVSTRDATLYTTTFPCHQCACLIVTAGIRRVVYIEPYPKSRALELHRDAIYAWDDDAPPHERAVRFEPFLGIAPHRYVELFSLTTRAGIPRDRKTRLTGERIRWDAKTSPPKIEMLPLSYLDLEAKALYQLKKFLGAKRGDG
jgi:deoxycytidylate deaminase